jgi:hypothetical protein
MRVIVHYGFDTETGAFFDPRPDTDNRADAHVVVDSKGCSYVNDVQATQLKADLLIALVNLARVSVAGLAR